MEFLLSLQHFIMPLIMRYFIKLSFAAKERPATFAQGGDGIKSVGTPQPAGFGEFRKWAAQLDGTAIDTEQGPSLNYKDK